MVRNLSKGVSMMMAQVFRAIDVVRIIAGPFRISSFLLLAICCLLGSPADARAQLWETPPLPPVKYSPAPDGMTFSVGAEQVHVSVCRSAVIHFVATPEPSSAVRQNQPWMLDSKESCPGAKFQISQTADEVILTTDTLKIEFSLKWGNVQYSTLGRRNPFAGAKLNSANLRTRRVERRENIPRRRSVFGGLLGGSLRSGSASEWLVQLPRSHRGTRPEQY